MKENKKGSKKDFLSGFMNNISLFIITIIVSFIFAFSFKPTYITYSICNQRRNFCDCGYNALKFDYTSGLLHIIISSLFFLIFVAIIACSIYFVINSIKRKKVIEIIMNIIFAIFIGFLVYRLPIEFFKLDRQYGNNLQVDEEFVSEMKERYGSDTYIDDCGI